MSKKTKQIFLIFIIGVILAILSSKLVGKIIYSFLKPVSGLGPQMQCPECFDGFILSYLFFVSLFFNFATFNNKNKYWLIFLFPIIIFINPPFEFLIIGIGLVAAGWLLAQGILLIYKKMKKVEKP